MQSKNEQKKKLDAIHSSTRPTNGRTDKQRIYKREDVYLRAQKFFHKTHANDESPSREHLLLQFEQRKKLWLDFLPVVRSPCSNNIETAAWHVFRTYKKKHNVQ